MCPPGFQFIFSFFEEKGPQLVPNIGKHTARRKLGIVPPRELGIVPILGVKNGPLRLYQKYLSGDTVSNFHFFI